MSNTQELIKTIDEVMTEWFESNFIAFEYDGTLVITEHQLVDLENMLIENLKKWVSKWQ